MTRRQAEYRNRDMRRYWLARMFMGEREIRCRLAAGFVLLAGILSLLVSFDRPGRQMDGAQAVAIVTAGIERAGAATRTIGETGRSVVFPVDGSIPRIEAWTGQIESVMGRYPWSTLLLGIGLGYVLARRRK